MDTVGGRFYGNKQHKNMYIFIFGMLFPGYPGLAQAVVHCTEYDIPLLTFLYFFPGVLISLITQFTFWEKFGSIAMFTPVVLDEHSTDKGMNRLN
jgi:hypothetical protein